jgi:hypothetical protein
MCGGIERGRCMRPKTSPSSVRRLSRQCGILKISQSYRPERPVKVIALLFYVYMIFVPHRNHTYGPPWPVKGVASLYTLNLVASFNLALLSKGSLQV